MLLLLMGPAGAGKTTVGRAVAQATGWPFHDADDLHPAANVAKIRAGTSLSDADREPWLDRVRALITDAVARREHAVIACSALRDTYRRQLDAGTPEVRWVFLAASPDVLLQRLERRKGHFAGTAILADQLRTLEPPSEALAVDSDRPVDDIVQDICTKLRLTCQTVNPKP